MQLPIKVAIQGEKASFHEIAARQYYADPVELVYCQSFDEVFNMLSSGDVNKAFVAVSNSSHGEINEVKLLLAHNKPILEGEYDMPIEQHLIGLAGTNLKEISTVISHPVALSQCSLYVETYLKGGTILDYHDTSAAVEYVKALADPSIVAIGSEAAAKLHNLQILRRGIQNDPNNTTLFQSFIAKNYQVGDSVDKT
jgi:prephenate dehydratase